MVRAANRPGRICLLTTTNVSTTGTKTITMTPISNTAANVDRYQNGEGLRLFVASYATMGANAPTMQITYTNSAGTAAGHYVGLRLDRPATSGTVLNSGNAANKYGPFPAVAGGRYRRQDIENLIWGGTAHASGSVFIGLCKPLCMPILSRPPASTTWSISSIPCPACRACATARTSPSSSSQPARRPRAAPFTPTSTTPTAAKMGLIGNGYRHNLTGRLFGATALDGGNPSTLRSRTMPAYSATSSSARASTAGWPRCRRRRSTRIPG